MMKTKHGGTKYVRYSEGYTIVHVCDTEVKLYLYTIRKHAFLKALTFRMVYGKWYAYKECFTSFQGISQKSSTTVCILIAIPVNRRSKLSCRITKKICMQINTE